MPKLKLTYFNMRGRAESARILLAIGGLDYEDIRIEREDWPKLKGSTPFGQIPLLEIDGETICQSHVIERYIANLIGLAGKTAVDKAKADMLVDSLEDALKPLQAIFFEKDEDKKKELREKYVEEDQGKMLDNIEAMLQRNGGGDGYFVGGEMTYADVVFFHYCSAFALFLGVDIDWSKWSKLNALKGKIEAHPKVAEWIAKRPATNM